MIELHATASDAAHSAGSYQITTTSRMFKQWRRQSSGAERVFAIIDRREPGNLLKSCPTLRKLESQRRVIDESEAPVTAEASLFATP
jgi:hypothetical protein